MTKYLLFLHGYTQNDINYLKKIEKLLTKTFLSDYIIIIKVQFNSDVIVLLGQTEGIFGITHDHYNDMSCI